MSRDVRKALMIAKGPVSSGYLPPGDPQRTANLARFMKGNHPDVPHVVYHHTPSDISNFIAGGPKLVGPHSDKNIDFDHSGRATWLTPDKEGRAAGWRIGSPGKYTEGTNVMPLHASLKNPAIYNDSNYEHMRSAYGSEFPYMISDEARAKLIKHGHDGVLSYGKDGLEELIVLNPERQLKSSTGNNGQYDLNEPEINKAEGGDVDDDQSQDTSSPAYQSTLSPAQTTPSSILTGALTNVFGDDRNAARWADKIDQLVDVAQPLYNIGQNFGQSAKSFLSGQYGQGAAQAGSGLMGAAMMAAPVPPPVKEEGVLAAEEILPKIIPDYSSVLAARPEEIARQAASAKFMEGSNAPPVMYHGTNAARMSHFTDFNQNAVLTDKFGNKTIKQFAGTRGNPGAKVVGYAAFDPDFAANFAGANNPEELANSQVSVYPVNVRATNIFDIANPEHRQMVGMEKADQSFLSKITPNFMHPWNWRDLEYNSNKIKNAGFDSYYDYENGINKSKTGIGVFDPRQIKSTFARRFDPEHPDIGEKRGGYITKATGGYIHDPERDIRKALLLSQMMKSGATLPAAVDLARQLKPGRR